jgi:hypothetical protein
MNVDTQIKEQSVDWHRQLPKLLQAVEGELDVLDQLKRCGSLEVSIDIEIGHLNELKQMLVQAIDN